MTQKALLQMKVIATLQEDTGLTALDCRNDNSPLSQLQSMLQVKEGNQPGTLGRGYDTKQSERHSPAPLYNQSHQVQQEETELVWKADQPGFSSRPFHLLNDSWRAHRREEGDFVKLWMLPKLIYQFQIKIPTELWQTDSKINTEQQKTNNWQNFLKEVKI